MLATTGSALLLSIRNVLNFAEFQFGILDFRKELGLGNSEHFV
jgi:hypothetical protein